MKHNFIVSEEDAGERLDKFLAAKSGLSRSYVQQLIENASRKVKAGEEISLEVPESKPLDLTPYDFDLDIVFENDDLIVLNKPVGLTVHPGSGNWDKTLVNALLYYCKGRLSGINGVERPGIVHRLDKNTSGLMVVAKTDEAHKRLAAQIEARKVKRLYKAVVCGVPSPSSGIIKTGYGRHPVDRKKMTTFDLTESVYASGGSSRFIEYNRDMQIEVGSKTEFGMERGEGKKSKLAVTEYKVLKVLGEGKAALVECKLQTGRTHQIRVHMKHINHPIIGDEVYGAKKKMKGIPDFPRQALHAYRLEIPGVGEFETDLPEDMQELIQQIK